MATNTVARGVKIGRTQIFQSRVIGVSVGVRDLVTAPVVSTRVAALAMTLTDSLLLKRIAAQSPRNGSTGAWPAMPGDHYEIDTTLAAGLRSAPTTAQPPRNARPGA